MLLDKCMIKLKATPQRIASILISFPYPIVELHECVTEGWPSNIVLTQSFDIDTWIHFDHYGMLCVGFDRSALSCFYISIRDLHWCEL